MARVYSVTGRDCCAEGFERLRSQAEFILLAYPGRDSTADSILAELEADLDSVMRPDGFDYEAAERALREWFAEGGAEWIRGSLAGLEWPSEEEEPAGLFFGIYVTEEESDS